MCLILFGFKGVGKSTLGREVGARLKLPFIDTDELLCIKHGHESIRQLYQQVGEQTFRILEKEVVFSLKNTPPSVIALGGGTVLDEENVAFLKALGRFVYLKASFSFLAKRLLQGELPSFATDKHFLQLIYEKRLPLYEGIAQEELDLEKEEEPADKLASLWRKLRGLD
ncbi:MAG: shikimate kinase [Chlamydiae bacterium]|nr:shikimate kinase [Chlamydiota bacterium]